jgi:hypothetical protein
LQSAIVWWALNGQGMVTVLMDCQLLYSACLHIAQHTCMGALLESGIADQQARYWTEQLHLDTYGVYQTYPEPFRMFQNLPVAILNKCPIHRLFYSPY